LAIEKIRSLITGQAPIVTSESAESAVNTVVFSAQKLIDATGFSFRPIDDAAKNTAKFYENW
jgi:hypothetical protein